MRTYKLLTVLTLFLLVPASITWAQTISTHKGLTTAVFSTSQGKITVYLPDDIRAGDTITGTMMAEPTGKNAKQLEKSLAEIKNMQLRLDGKPVLFSALGIEPGKLSAFEWRVQEEIKPNCPVELMTSSGTKPLQVTYEFKKPEVEKPSQPSGCFIPSHILTGNPIGIRGNFDGEASNTQCLLNNQPLQILAESPRQCIVMYPQDARGAGTFSVKEDELEKCSRTVSGVDMQITAGNLNLKRGQSTYIDIKITGLQNLPDKAVLTVANLTPGIVTITNGNLQVVPIWPMSDTSAGVFTLHCPAVSINTGTFSVNVNLDLPQTTTTTSETEIPPGYIRKSCDCSVSVSVSKTGNSFKAEAKPECKGQYGIGINTFPGCSVMSTTYEWSIISGKENAELAGNTKSAAVNVRPKSSGAYTACVVVTVTCVDGTVCTSTKCIDNTGKEVVSPGTVTKPPDTKPPAPDDTKKPPPTTTVPESSKCSCHADCTITAGAKKGNETTYTANVKAECKGSSGTGNTRVQCTVGPITYNWSIGASGKDVAEIVGKTDGPSVTVKLKKDGAYNLYLNGTVTCSDGTVCTYSCNVEIPLIPVTSGKACMPIVEEKVEPAMDGGLKAHQIGSGGGSSMNRDEFIALEAEGGDWDQAVFKCEPQKPDCPDSRSEKIIPLIGRVRFEWKIEGDNKGNFVKLGCLPEALTAEGERVIFKPPVVPLPVKANDTTIITTIKLFILDDGSPVADETVEKTITIKTKRKKSNPDKYEIEISGGKGKLPAIPAASPALGTCLAKDPVWTPKDNLTKPDIILPPVPDNNKMVLGQWIILTTPNQSDPDDVKFICESKANCNTTPLEKSYPDKVEYSWEIVSGGGKFILGNAGRFVIYEAPLEMPRGKEEVEVKFRVTVKNPAGARKDPDKKHEEVVLKFYQPGVKLSHPSLTWLPEEDNNLGFTSSLQYKESGQWRPALAHMCRIHFFELLNVSAEKGVCMNDPVPKEADECRDLKLNNEDQHEAFDDKKAAGKCTQKEMFLQARTQKPEKEYSLKVYSQDFGSYGLFRSFANVNKGGKDSIRGEKPLYIPIPAHEAHELRHPLGRAKKNRYSDNRVTIPYDIDENQIADNGWTANGGVRMRDPAVKNEDDDNSPVGDGFKGDGLSTYQEYRGFKVLVRNEVMHIRTNYDVKDIFIRNRDNLSLTLYASVSGLDVHEISENQYGGDNFRVINFNNSIATHVVDQRGLKLINAGNHATLLGIAESLGALEPTIPNFEKEIRVYRTKVERVCQLRNLPDCNAKLNAVVAHELLHGNNVCHHGEGDETRENSFDLRQGLRSGNVSCVMRYDNVGTIIRGFNPEAVGTSLCNSATGTGYNANNQAFGDAKDKRGNCRGQIRISGKGGRPKSCGNR
jgi:hypothetical protein